MNTLENNKLIASFLGQKETISEFPQFGYMTISGDWKTDFTPNELKFHKDWNWLMELVEKIETIGFETSLDKNGFFIRMNGGNTQKGLFHKNKMEGVFNACVEFINWHSAQKL